MKGRVAVVTGAGSGIGAATAELLGLSGAKVALLDLRLDRLQQVAISLSQQEVVFHTKQVDVSVEEDVRKAFQEIGALWGRIDVVVANAGINGIWAPLVDITAAEWDLTLAVNLRSTFLTLKHSVPWLRQGGGGSIIVVSSINGNRVFSTLGATAYACSKAAQIALMKMSALEYARDRIRINAICPGSVATHIDESLTARNLDFIRRRPVQFPEGEVPLGDGAAAQADQVAEIAWFLASDYSNHVTGTEIYVDGAQSLLKG
ncbi:MAG: SDR family oxidoreductase [Verrucomicrobiales bacterium]|nr:SDR family oxidoreductase [Verrucomicrobiales bacterium]